MGAYVRVLETQEVVHNEGGHGDRASHVVVDPERVYVIVKHHIKDDFVCKPALVLRACFVTYMQCPGSLWLAGKVNRASQNGDKRTHW